ncbi:unnamed protein product, partial [Staurois parvus]
MTAWHWGQTLDRLAGQRASGHQASGHLARTAGTASSGKAVGTKSPSTTVGSDLNWHKKAGTRVIRYRIVWLDSGHRVTRYDSGHWVTRHQVIW